MVTGFLTTRTAREPISTSKQKRSTKESGKIARKMEMGPSPTQMAINLLGFLRMETSRVKVPSTTRTAPSLSAYGTTMSQLEPAR